MFETDINAFLKKARKEKIETRLKVFGLFDWVIEEIVESIDLEKQYSILTTRDIKELEKNSYEEFYENEGYSCNVSIEPLYGYFSAGIVNCDGQIIPPEIGEGVIAFIKTITVHSNNKTKTQNNLIVYISDK